MVVAQPALIPRVGRTIALTQSMPLSIPRTVVVAVTSFPP